MDSYAGFLALSEEDKSIILPLSNLALQDDSFCGVSDAIPIINTVSIVKTRMYKCLLIIIL
jgi:hypothetical protein